MAEKDWEVFQSDVLDVLRQYRGFFDFFERVGSLSDDSRPDAFARITREEKKEIWVIDAKNKPEIGEEDRKRMQKYVEMVGSNPVDVGLEMKELSDHQIRGIFVTPADAGRLEKYENVGFRSFHQFLQKELIYTDSEKIVRDVAKMAERKQLSQNQARLLFRSLKPFENRVERAMDSLESLETRYVGLELKEPPLSRYDFKVPVDAVLTHSEREKAFLFDIPYSREVVEEVDQKVSEVKHQLSGIEKQVFYAAVNTFEKVDSEYVLQPEEVEQEVRETASIISLEEVAEMFTPKIKTEKNYTDRGIEVKDTRGVGFRMEVLTSNDVEYTVTASLPEEALKQVKEAGINARKELGEITAGSFRLEFTVTEDGMIGYGEAEESLEGFQDAVRSIYQSSVNPVLSGKVKKMV